MFLGRKRCTLWVWVLASITQVQAHGAVQAAAGVAPARNAVRAPGHGNLQREVAGGGRLLRHQSVGGVQELRVRHRLTHRDFLNE